MSAVATLPFRATKKFVLEGRQVLPGDVVDVSMLDARRVRNMESGHFGIRVAAEGPDHEQTASASGLADTPVFAGHAADPNVDDLDDDDFELDDDLLAVEPERAVAASSEAKPSPSKTRGRARASAKE